MINMKNLINKYTKIHDDCRKKLRNYPITKNDDERLWFLEFEVKTTGKALNSVKSVDSGNKSINDVITDHEEWVSKLQARVDSGIADSDLDKESDVNQFQMSMLEYDVNLLNGLILDLREWREKNEQ